MCTDYLSNSTLFPLGTTHLPGPCSVCTKKHTKGRDDCNVNLPKLRKFRVKAPRATLPLPLAYAKGSYSSLGFPRQRVQREDKENRENCMRFFLCNCIPVAFLC